MELGSKEMAKFAGFLVVVGVGTVALALGLLYIALKCIMYFV